MPSASEAGGLSMVKFGTKKKLGGGCASSLLKKGRKEGRMEGFTHRRMEGRESGG
jgi:hypothetical protein